MENVLESLPRGGRVAIIRLRSLGDCVLTTPALAILRQFRPDLKIGVVVEDRFREIFEGSPDVDQILPPLLARLRGLRSDVCLNLHGGTRSAWMTALSGARYRAGFGHFRNRPAYNVRIPRAQEILGVERKVHTAEHLASAMFYLGVPFCEIPRARLTAARNAKTCAVIHPAAAAAAKTWRPRGFLDVAKHLQQSGLDVVFIGSASDDLAPFGAYPVRKGATLGQIKSLLAAAAVFVGNDSGPAHMAAAFGVPSVVLFGNSDPEIWGPWRTTSEVISSPAGIHEIRTDQVLQALDRLRVHA
ncbi:MAG: glycosyltransferase family 9 protein [Acidobacteriia bacterium]|nr:glycosyltransferase family 9 protein [Terriglobia bacterium]